MMFISSFGHCSLRRSGGNNPLEGRGVRVLTCSRRQIEIVATQTILKMDKRPSKHFSLQQRTSEEQQSDSYTNHTNWYDDQSITTKDSQHNMANKRSPCMRWDETTDLTVVNDTVSNDAGSTSVQHITRLKELRGNDFLRNKEDKLQKEMDNL